MPTLLAILAAAAVTAGKGGLPGDHTRVKRRPTPHLHTPCSPNHSLVEQVRAATKSAWGTGQAPHPQGTNSLAQILADGWQVCPKASRGTRSPIPTALHPPRAVASTTTPTDVAHEATGQAHGPTPNTTESSAFPPTHDAPTSCNDPPRTVVLTIGESL